MKRRQKGTTSLQASYIGIYYWYTLQGKNNRKKSQHDKHAHHRNHTQVYISTPNVPYIYVHSGIRVFALLLYTKLGWVGKHINIITKPTNPPTQGQPNPRKIRLKVAFGPPFAAATFFRGLGFISYRKQTARNPTQPNSLHPLTSECDFLIYTAP